MFLPRLPRQRSRKVVVFPPKNNQSAAGSSIYSLQDYAAIAYVANTATCRLLSYKPLYRHTTCITPSCATFVKSTAC